MSDSVGESMMGLGAELFHTVLEVGGALGHGVAAMPLAGTAVHGGLAAYHAYEMWQKGKEAEGITDPDAHAKALAEVEKEGLEVQTNALEAIPLVGAVAGVAGVVNDLGFAQNEDEKFGNVLFNKMLPDLMSPGAPAPESSAGPGSASSS